MYNVKYKLVEIEEINRRNNVVHDVIKGKTCYLAYFNKGERGWFLCDTEEGFDSVHRVHTSEVCDVQHSRGNQIVVLTKNTKYVFEAILG